MEFNFVEVYDYVDIEGYENDRDFHNKITFFNESTFKFSPIRLMVQEKDVILLNIMKM